MHGFHSCTGCAGRVVTVGPEEDLDGEDELLEEGLDDEDELLEDELDDEDELLDELEP